MTPDIPQTESIPPMPNTPDHPERLPPNIPIPGELTFSSKERKFKCKKCGKLFNTKDELKAHLAAEHSKKTENSKK